MRWCVLVLLVSFVLGSQYVSIPKTPYGLTVGDPEGRLHIQAFYDLLCIPPIIQASTPRRQTTSCEACSRP